ncbi:phosphoribosyltransferase [Halorarius litoreus]|uniref:phosphoribosyltransferase n=1 Tax=Halorarius litoreus TaxID=2962676 RepID=UPI0020CF6B01|nr:phosphoribosyltransferase family protein [Halorarius litoreus]
MFTDRTDAGHQLADHLRAAGIEADVVLAVPRGGLPVARPVADALGAPLDVVVARKLGAPGNAELAIGAVADDGSYWVNDDLVGRLGVREEYLEDEREHQAELARQKADSYARGVDLRDKRVVIVDDGVATGATTLACIRRVKAAGASHVTLAVPVGPPDTLDWLAREADAVVALEEPPGFGAVGAHYRDFRQVEDDDALVFLR